MKKATQPGTVLFFRHDGFFPSLIRMWTQSTWDHVAIIVRAPIAGQDTSRPLIVEAVPGGVRLRELGQLEPAWWCNPLSDDPSGSVLSADLQAYANLMRGRGYDWLNDLRAAFDLPRVRNRQRQCVELVIGALKRCGVNIPTSILRPQDLADYLCGWGGPYALALNAPVHPRPRS